MARRGQEERAQDVREVVCKGAEQDQVHGDLLPVPSGELSRDPVQDPEEEELDEDRDDEEARDRKNTRLNSNPPDLPPLPLPAALPISPEPCSRSQAGNCPVTRFRPRRRRNSTRTATTRSRAAVGTRLSDHAACWGRRVSNTPHL